MSWIVAEADPAVMPDAVFAAMDDESVQVLIAAAVDELKSRVQVGDGAVAAKKQPSPDQRADTAQLVHHRIEVRGRLRHCAIMAPVATSPVVPLPWLCSLSPNYASHADVAVAFRRYLPEAQYRPSHQPHPFARIQVKSCLTQHSPAHRARTGNHGLLRGLCRSYRLNIDPDINVVTHKIGAGKGCR